MKNFLLFLAIFSASLVRADTMKTVLTDTPVTFSLTVDGTPPFTYQWRKDGVNILGATAITYMQYSAQTKDTGSYDCIITNSAGSTISDKGVLTVTPPPPPVVPPSNGRVKMT